MAEGPYQAKARAIYTELRQNIVDNVYKVCTFAFRTAVRTLTMSVTLGIRAFWLCLGTV